MARVIDGDALMVWLVNMLNEFDDGNDYTGIKREIFECVLAKVRKTPIIDAEPVQKWISVKDRLPKAEEPNADGEIVFSKRVLVCLVYEDGFVYITGDSCNVAHECWVTEIPGERCKVTHWMPLPEPPEMDGDAT